MSLLLFTFGQSLLPVYGLVVCLPAWSVLTRTATSLVPLENTAPCNAVAAGAKPLHSASLLSGRLQRPHCPLLDTVLSPSLSICLHTHIFLMKTIGPKLGQSFVGNCNGTSNSSSIAIVEGCCCFCCFCNSGSQSSKQHGNLFNNGAAYLIRENNGHQNWRQPQHWPARKSKRRHRRRKSILFYSACMHIKKLHFPILIIIANDPRIEEWLRFGMRITKRNEKGCREFTFACFFVACAAPKWIYLIRWLCSVFAVCVVSVCAPCPPSHSLATRCSRWAAFCTVLGTGAGCWQMRCGQASNSLTLAYFLFGTLCVSRRSNNLTPNVLPLLAHNQTHNCAHAHTQALYSIDK